jgi:hypothetical protein
MYQKSSLKQWKWIRYNAGGRFMLSFLFFALAITSVSAQGNLLLTPRRIVMEGSKKTADLNVANTGKDTAKYMVTLVEQRMKEDGTFETITSPDPGQNFASKYLRVFPRSVVLGPNESQVVKVQLHNTGKMAPGEYRSHIYLRAVPEEKPLGEAEAKTNNDAISVQLIAVFGITIPVIVRIGESNARVELSDISFNMVRDSIPDLKLAFHRTGNMSVYGDLSIDHISKEGKTTNVYLARGLSVYSPNTIRKIDVALDRKPEVSYSSGTLRVTYVSQSGSKEKLAETEIKLD